MRLYGHNPVVGGLVPTGKNETEINAALDGARAEAGEANWKRGNSGNLPNGATLIARAKLEAIGYVPQPLTGKCTKISMDETRDNSGNVYTKLRVRLDGDAGGMLSLDVSSEVAQRLIQKLDQVTPGSDITINAFATPVVRDGREFVNHVASVKDQNGAEVKSAGGFWEKAQEAANAAAAALTSMGISDKKLINTAKATKKVEAHRELLQSICQRYAQTA